MWRYFNFPKKLLKLSKLSNVVKKNHNGQKFWICKTISKIVKMLVRSCFLITLIKCLKGRKSLEGHSIMSKVKVLWLVPGGYLLVPGGYLWFLVCICWFMAVICRFLVVICGSWWLSCTGCPIELLWTAKNITKDIMVK